MKLKKKIMTLKLKSNTHNEVLNFDFCQKHIFKCLKEVQIYEFIGFFVLFQRIIIYSKFYTIVINVK